MLLLLLCCCFSYIHCLVDIVAVGDIAVVVVTVVVLLFLLLQQQPHHHHHHQHQQQQSLLLLLLLLLSVLHFLFPFLLLVFLRLQLFLAYMISDETHMVTAHSTGDCTFYVGRQVVRGKSGESIEQQISINQEAKHGNTHSK